MDVREKAKNDKRLIDANALCRKFGGEPWYDNADLDEIALPLVDDAPTIDAVEVIRCRECKHRYTENCLMYFHDSYWYEGYEEYVDYDTDHTEDDYFCPKGERKEGAD